MELNGADRRPLLEALVLSQQKTVYRLVRFAAQLSVLYYCPPKRYWPPLTSGLNPDLRFCAVQSHPASPNVTFPEFWK